MHYFQILGVSFGIIAFLKPFYMHLIPWDENKFIAKAYTEKRPWWILPVAILGLLLVGFTWYKELTTDIPYSIIITILFSLTSIKAIVFLYDYQKFFLWIESMLKKEEGKQIVWVDIAAGIFGLLLILLSLLLF